MASQMAILLKACLQSLPLTGLQELKFQDGFPELIKMTLGD